MNRPNHLHCHVLFSTWAFPKTFLILFDILKISDQESKKSQLGCVFVAGTVFVFVLVFVFAEVVWQLQLASEYFLFMLWLALQL